MAKISDIDTEFAVNRFLAKPLVRSRLNPASNGDEETESLMETVSRTLLESPKIAQSLIQKARNSLLQVVTKEIGVLDYLIEALKDVRNPDKTVENTSDITEAKTALLEVSKTGSITGPAFLRYDRAINRILKKELAPAVKRHSKGELERSGTEAKEDINAVMDQLPGLHQELLDRLNQTSKAADEFQQQDLSKKLVPKTAERVQSSLSTTKKGLDSNSLSLSSATLELMSGRAAMKGSGVQKKLYDPVIQTGVIPAGHTYVAEAEAVSPISKSLAGPFDLSGDPTPWKVDITVRSNGTTASLSRELPYLGASNAPYILSRANIDPLTIAFGQHQLYLQIGPTVYTIFLGIGVIPFSTLVTTINVAINGFIPGSQCVESGPGTKKLLIFCPGQPQITVLPADPVGTVLFSGALLLGFDHYQASKGIGIFSAEDVQEFLSSEFAPSGRALVTVDQDKVLITGAFSGTPTTDPDSYVQVTDTPPTIGLPTAEPEPGFLVLKEGTSSLVPKQVDVIVGAKVSTADAVVPPRTMSKAEIIRIEGFNLYFSVPVSRCRAASVTVEAPGDQVTKDLTRETQPHISKLENRIPKIQRLMSPILSKHATQAQIGDASKELQLLKTDLVDLQSTLGSISIPQSKMQNEAEAKALTQSLEERGLDRAVELLRSARFAEFFNIPKDALAKSTRMMRAVEEVGRNDLRQSSAEVNLPDGNLPAGDNQDENELPNLDVVDEDSE